MSMSTLINIALITTPIVIIGLYIIGIYNNLVTYKKSYENAFRQIEVQLQRRYDLIPNLVETVKGYMSHERTTLEAVIAARNGASASLTNAAKNVGQPAALNKLAQAEQALQGAVGQFNLVFEDYPDLKANDSIMQLVEELTSTENRVAFSRQAFNDTVTLYNIYRQRFPNILFASSFGHPEDAGMLELPDSEVVQAAPEVKFS